MREVKVTLFKHRFWMREGVKAIFAVVTPHPRCPDTAKRQILLGNVKNRFVNTRAATHRMREHVVGVGFVLAKHIQRQWAVTLIHIRHRLRQVLVGHQWQYRGKNLLCQQLSIAG